MGAGAAGRTDDEDGCARKLAKSSVAIVIVDDGWMKATKVLDLGKDIYLVEARYDTLIDI